MYTDEMITIGKVENGYIVGVRAPYKDDDDSKMPCCGSEMKQFAVKTCEEAGKMVAELLPKLEDKMQADEMFKGIIKEMSDD